MSSFAEYREHIFEYLLTYYKSEIEKYTRKLYTIFIKKIPYNYARETGGCNVFFEVIRGEGIEDMHKYLTGKNG